MKQCILFLVVAISCQVFSQDTTHNFDFETLDDHKAKDWSVFGGSGFAVNYNTDVVQHGKISASIESTGGNGDFNALAYSIPADFGGEKIKLTGYIKTKNVSDGWAGLWMRIDPNVAFDNMQSRGITGSTEWTKYTVELDLKRAAKKIVIGGILVGKGKMWVDNLEVTINGKALDNAPEKILLPAQKDSEFNNGSNISITNTDENSVNNLELLGRVWGFLKYYHPVIGTGDYNWDYELFRMLPDYLKTTSIKQRDNLLLDWINTYGEVKKCSSCKEVNPEAFLKPDFSWLDNGKISTTLKNKLQFIRNNRHQGDHFYIGMTANVGNPEFKNERDYENMPYPDDGFRLLALYRYWNAINYFFPYKHLTDKDWNTTLKEYLPEFINAKNELEFEKAMIKIIGDVKDTHANLWRGRDKFQEEIGPYFPSFHTRFIEEQLTILDFYNSKAKQKVNLEIGDVITHINGRTIPEIIKEVETYYPASNKPTRMRDIGFNILRSQNKTLEIKIKRHNKTFEKTISLDSVKNIEGYYRWYKAEKETKSYKLLNNNVGYVTLKNIKAEDVDLLMEKFKNTQGIIVDIRNYPSAFMPFRLAPYFTSKDSPFVKFTNGNINNPGEFTFGKTLSVPKKANAYKGKVVILVDEISQSQAEYTAMSFRAGDNVTIVGSTTAGADGNVSNIALPGGMRTMISGIGVYYPDGTETQRIGIVPDVEVKPTLKGIKEGRDELLEKAIEIISKSIKTPQTIKN